MRISLGLRLTRMVAATMLLAAAQAQALMRRPFLTGQCGSWFRRRQAARWT